MGPGKTFGKNANSCHCGISMPTAGACKHWFGIVQVATSKPNSPSAEAGGLPMRHRSFEHPAMSWHVCMGKQTVIYVVKLWAQAVQNFNLTVTHLICFASVVGQCQDLHGQGFCTNAANQLHEVSCILQIICKATYLCKALFESREQAHNLNEAHQLTWAITCHRATANHGSHTKAHLQSQSWLCQNLPSKQTTASHGKITSHLLSKLSGDVFAVTQKHVVCNHSPLENNVQDMAVLWQCKSGFWKHHTKAGKALRFVPACQEIALLHQARQHAPHRSKC